MPLNPKANLDTLWLSEGTALQINSDAYEELRIADRALVLRDWVGDEEILAEQEELLGDGPPRALVVRDPSRPTIAVLVGEEGSELLRLDLERPGWTRMAELPRANNDVGGMRRLEILPRTGVTLLHWELGVLALDHSLELRWRHDLEWNHRLIHLDDEEIWFDLKYEAVSIPQRIGDEPWGFSVLDGRHLFDRIPPASEP
jgi:hypothetical protein